MNRTYSQQAAPALAVVTTAETVAALTNGVSLTYDNDQVNVTGNVLLTAGTGTTSVTVRCRRGNGVNGAIVGTAQPVSVVAGNNVALPVDFLDTPGAVAGQQYSITVAQTGATANGTIVSYEVTITVGN